MKQAVVTAARCPLMSRPSRRSTQVDELLLGWSAQVLAEVTPGWLQVRSAYGYEGFASACCLAPVPEGGDSFAQAEKQVVTRALCAVLSVPRVQGYVVAELTRGALVAPLTPPDGEGWLKAALPGGRTGYTKSSFLGVYHKSSLPDQKALRRATADAALSYLGAPYRWGGKSPLGIDCSGLTFMAYWLQGVTIFRDARIEPGYPVHEIPREQMALGDLLYFPGHVALYLGDGRYVHATARTGSDGVVVNSLDPAAPDYRPDLAGSLYAVGSLF